MSGLARKIAQKFVDIDPDMLLKMFQDYLESVEKEWNYILPTELNKVIEKGLDEFFIVDIRRPEDFAMGHLKGAINIFWLDMLKPENMKKLPRDKKILLYCYLGHTSSQMIPILRLLGYDVLSLKFGLGISPVKGVPMAGWVDYNFDLIK